MTNGTQILDQYGRPMQPPPSALQKGWKTLPQDNPKRAPKTFTFDPLSLMYSLGYKDRQFSLTYDVIRQVTKQLSLTSAIIKHRISQVLQFCSPYRLTRNSSGLGFEIKHKSDDRPMSASEKRFARELENFVLYCGNPKPNKYTGKRRPDFETFTKKFLRDLLELDQGCFEIVPTRRNIPYEFMAVDGATIRLAAEQGDLGKKYQKVQNEVMRTMYQALGRQSLWPQYKNRSISPSTEKISHIQLVRGQIETLYRDGEMAFCTQNPRTDIQAQGYGESNTELLIRVITAHLYAEQYNLNIFRQGSIPKSLFNIVGENVDPKQLEEFKRQWHAQLTGVENTWRAPFLSGPEIQHIQLTGSNQEMEYQNWMNYLIRLQCAVWQIDTAEIGFELQASQGQFAPPQYETPQEWKIKKSKDRGLRPLLRYFAYCLNKNVIDRIDDHFYLDFVGLDELDQKETVEVLQQETSVYRTMNESREAQGMEPLEDGDVVLNSVYLQWKQMQMNVAMMEQQQQQQQAAQQHEALMGHMQGGGEEAGVQPPANTPEGEAPPQQEMPSTMALKSLTAEEDELQARLDHINGYVEVRL